MPEKRGKMRKIANDADDDDLSTFQEKRQRKKWTMEETQMLVDGCNAVRLYFSLFTLLYFVLIDEVIV